MSAGRNIADVMSDMVKNDTTTLTNQLLRLDGAHIEVAADGNPEQELMSALMKLGYAPVRMVEGLAFIVSGVAISLIPKKKVEVIAVGISSVPASKEYEKLDMEQWEITSVKLTNDASGVLKFKQETSAKTMNGEPIVKDDGSSVHVIEENEHLIPHLPSTPKNTIDFAERRKLACVTTKTTLVSGTKVAATGVSTVLSAGVDIVSATCTIAIEGGRRLYGHFRPAQPAAPAAPQPNNNNNPAGPQ